jgi:hypothetical protein
MGQVRIINSIASAEWSYSAQQVVAAGSAFAPDEIPAAVADAWVASGIAEAVADDGIVRIVRSRAAQERAVAPVAETAETPAVPDPPQEWPHKMPPEQYLRRFPEGPDADLARALVEAE